MPGETTLSAETFESEIYNRLLETSTLDDLHANLLFSLQRAGWAERIQSLSQELLRAGRCTHFDDVVDVVVTLATGQKHPAVPEANTNTTSTNSSSNGHDTNTVTNGNTAIDSESFFRHIDVRIPKEIVEQGARALKDSIRSFATIEDDEDGTEVDGAHNGHDTVGAKELANGKNPVKSEKKHHKSGKDLASTAKSNDVNLSPTKSTTKDKKTKSGGKDTK